MVEAAVSQQLPGMVIIGLPDASLSEAKQRVRTATAQAGLPLSDRLVTINLAPAALPKQGSSFDLAIALAALAASQHLPITRLAETAHIGELGLDGSVRRPVGLLSAVIAAKELGFTRVMVPHEGGAEARLVHGIEVIEVGDLSSAVAWHRGDPFDPRESSQVSTSRKSAGSEPARHADTPDMADVVGQPEAVEAMVIAAAGRHHVSLLGPPGAGKTLLAERLPTVLPDLSPSESLTVSSIASLDGSQVNTLITRPPFVRAHHTATSAAISGSGDSRGIRPGALTRACHGVLFLDEAPEFGRKILDNLRQPLESGTIDIMRAHVRTTLPARIQLVLAANPCPCGNAGAPETAPQCRCTPATRVRYMQRISGPLNDRIDLRLTVRRVANAQYQEATGQSRTTSSELLDRVREARARASARLSHTPWSVNSEVTGDWLRGPELRLPKDDTFIIDRALSLGALTMRGYDRTLRLAWSIADLAGRNRPGRRELAQALELRGGATV
ncbi:YifB family Mg chelatase-like AAA ATPase [Leucobacter denitrificans]|nr:YifB family Mg chelatase-like AAA ATPase [Leucobacter denitrificans]